MPYNNNRQHDHDEQYEHDNKQPRHELAVPTQPKLPALFADLGLGRVSTKDKLTIAYGDGTIKATVKRTSGVTQTVVRNVKAGFRSMTEFDPGEMRNKAERNSHIRRLYKQGLTQVQLGEQFGLSQSMINRIINE